MITGKFKDAKEMKNFKLDPQHSFNNPMDSCEKCKKHLGVLVEVVGGKKFHPMCAWLHGLKFKLIKKYQPEKKERYVDSLPRFIDKQMQVSRNNYMPD